MKSPNKHGIDRVNLKIPKKGWRLVILFRNLQPKINRQAENHRIKCKNNDANGEMMKNCVCHTLV